MSSGEYALPAEVIQRNREVCAQRSGWPEGALDACQAIERQYPEWSVYYVPGEMPKYPLPGYAAYRDPHKAAHPFFYAAEPDALMELIKSADAERDRKATGAHYR